MDNHDWALDGTFVFLVIMVAVAIILRAKVEAARNSAKEEVIRKVVRDHIRKRKLDELYGRDQE